MIEELRDYLVRVAKISDDVADDIHDAYYHNDVSGVIEFARSLGTDEHDDLVQLVRDWIKEAGE
jgi:hypothetical protein